MTSISGCYGDPKDVAAACVVAAVNVDALGAWDPKEVDFVTEVDVFLPVLKNF